MDFVKKFIQTSCCNFLIKLSYYNAVNLHLVKQTKVNHHTKNTKGKTVLIILTLGLITVPLRFRELFQKINTKFPQKVNIRLNTICLKQLNYPSPETF